MAALDLTAPPVFPYIRNTTLGTAGNVRLINLPTTGAYVLSFFPRGNDAKFLDASNTQAEDAAIGGSAYATLPANAWTEVDVSALGGTKCYLASATSSLVVEVVLGRRTVGP